MVRATTQTPETIDDAPPPFESSVDENQQEEYEPPQTNAENVHQNHQSRGVAFPPQNSRPNAPQPPQFSPQAFPPAQDDEPQAFPPQSQAHETQAFPPPQPIPEAFPPPQGVQPQAFPPPQGGQPQAFPPPQGGQPQAFPPPQGHQPHAFVQQNSPVFNSNPQFINNTPMPGFPVVQPLPTEPWNTSLFECMNDPTNALITLCFPCVTFGQIAEIIDSGQTPCSTSGLLYGCIAFFIAMPCLLSCTYRTKLRARFGLIETPAPDWLVHCFCEPCALCQEYRELQKRDLDPSIGWLGNVAKSQQRVQMGAMMPPPRQNMMG